MKTKVTYKINSKQGLVTYVHEFWDDIHVYTWRVPAIYHGGNIQEFMEKNEAFRIPNFDGIEEYLGV